MNTSSPKSRFRLAAGIACFVLSAGACSTLPETKFKKHKFPREKAYLEEPAREYRKLGLVRAKVNFQSLDVVHEETELCRNYYNKAVKDLVKMAKERGADAVIDVKSVVFLENGAHELYPTPECSDDGFEGQILVQGIAIKWKPSPDSSDS